MTPAWFIVLQGLLNIFGLIAFFAGYHFEISWLMLAGGIMIVLDVVQSMIEGVRNPLFPFVLALILSYYFRSYFGILWASAFFAILDIPGSVKRILSPKAFIDEARKHINY